MLVMISTLLLPTYSLPPPSPRLYAAPSPDTHCFTTIFTVAPYYDSNSISLYVLSLYGVNTTSVIRLEIDEAIGCDRRLRAMAMSYQ
jgi:hypothetical protein